jgi:predicted  nucleic acid-binding Zn ribbon protein
LTVTERIMFRWRTPQGMIVADIRQVARQTPRGPVARYIARVSGEQVEKERFACAQRVVQEWLRKNRIQASPD